MLLSTKILRGIPLTRLSIGSVLMVLLRFHFGKWSIGILEFVAMKIVSAMKQPLVFALG